MIIYSEINLLSFYTYNMNKKSLLFFIVLLVALFTTLAFAFKPKDPNADKLKRLDVISTRLAEITKRQTVLSWEINEREMEYFDLNEESIVLNDEASSIFMKLMEQKELVDQEEPKSQCDALIEQELKNIELWIQTKEWFIGLVAWAWCEYDWPFPETEWYPWKLTEDGSMQELPILTAVDSHQRFKELCEDYWLDASLIYKLEDKYWLVEGMLPAILIAETSWWHNGNYVWSGCYNLWNVANNDRWDRVCFDTKEESIEKVAQTLNNKYLWWIQTLWCLSNAWSCLQKYDTGYRYATSNGSWERNVQHVLEHIYMTNIDPITFTFRK